MQQATEGAAELLLSQARGKSLQELDQLRWAVSPIVQRQLYSLWRSAWDLGAAHGLEEMQAAVPEQTKRQAEATTFALDAQTLSLIAALLTQQPGLIIPIGVEQAILARVLTIAGLKGNPRQAQGELDCGNHPTGRATRAQPPGATAANRTDLKRRQGSRRNNRPN